MENPNPFDDFHDSLVKKTSRSSGIRQMVQVELRTRPSRGMPWDDGWDQLIRLYLVCTSPNQAASCPACAPEEIVVHPKGATGLGMLSILRFLRCFTKNVAFINSTYVALTTNSEGFFN
jgi:hypothetical protein